ncbi:MAG: hypothetical protein AB7V45_09655 [Candidatus Krumholzibacteriia bacterium]
MNHYQAMIREQLATFGMIGVAPLAHVEALMRLENPCLDHLSPIEFAREAETAAEEAAASPVYAAQVADSLGVR